MPLVKLASVEHDAARRSSAPPALSLLEPLHAVRRSPTLRAPPHRPPDESSRLHRRAPPLVGAFDATTALLLAHRGAPSTRSPQAWGQPSFCARASTAGVSRRCATIRTWRFGSCSGPSGLRSAPSRSRSRATSRPSRSPARPSRVPWRCSAPAGRCSPAGSCSGRSVRGMPSARSSSRRLRLVSRRVGQPRRRLGRRLHDRPRPRTRLPASRRPGRCSPTRRPSRFPGRSASPSHFALAGRCSCSVSLPALFYDPATLGCVAMPGQSPARPDEPGALDDLNRARCPSRACLVASPDRGRRLESRSLEQVEAARRRAGRPRRLRLPRPRRRHVRHEPRPRVSSGSGDAPAPAVARSSGRSRGPRGQPSRGACSELAARARPSRGSSSSSASRLPPAACGTRSPRRSADPGSRSPTRSGEGRYADARGRSVDARCVGRSAATPLVRDGRPVACSLHRADLLDNPELVEEVASAARLALENERLQAEARAQLEDLRSSRARIVEAGDAERRRLERDLHDGAQQRLVGLSLALRLAARAGSEASDDGSSRRARRGRGRAPPGGRPSCASSRTASTRPCSATRASPLPSRRSPEERRRRCASSALPQERFPAGRRDGGLSRRRRGREGGPPASVSADQAGRHSRRRRRGGSRAGGARSTWRIASARWTGASRSSRPPGGGVRIRAEIPCG